MELTPDLVASVAPATWPPIVTAVAAVLTASIAAVGAVSSYLRFFRGRTLKARPQIDISAEIDSSDGFGCVSVCVRILNAGQVAMTIVDPPGSPNFLRAYSLSRQDLSHLAQNHYSLAWDDYESYDQQLRGQVREPLLREEELLEPGVSRNYPLLLPLANSVYACLLCVWVTVRVGWPKLRDLELVSTALVTREGDSASSTWTS